MGWRDLPSKKETFGCPPRNAHQMKRNPKTLFVQNPHPIPLIISFEIASKNQRTKRSYITHTHTVHTHARISLSPPISQSVTESFTFKVQAMGFNNFSTGDPLVNNSILSLCSFCLFVCLLISPPPLFSFSIMSVLPPTASFQLTLSHSDKILAL